MGGPLVPKFKPKDDIGSWFKKNVTEKGLKPSDVSTRPLQHPLAGNAEVKSYDLDKNGTVDLEVYTSNSDTFYYAPANSALYVERFGGSDYDLVVNASTDPTDFLKAQVFSKQSPPSLVTPADIDAERSERARKSKELLRFPSASNDYRFVANLLREDWSAQPRRKSQVSVSEQWSRVESTNVPKAAYGKARYRDPSTGAEFLWQPTEKTWLLLRERRVEFKEGSFDSDAEIQTHHTAVYEQDGHGGTYRVSDRRTTHAPFETPDYMKGKNETKPRPAASGTVQVGQFGSATNVQKNVDFLNDLGLVTGTDYTVKVDGNLTIISVVPKRLSEPQLKAVEKRFDVSLRQ